MHGVYVCTHTTLTPTVEDLGVQVSLLFKCMEAMSEHRGYDSFKSCHLFQPLWLGTVSHITECAQLKAWY